jgi:hypothetical protein
VRFARELGSPVLPRQRRHGAPVDDRAALIAQAASATTSVSSAVCCPQPCAASKTPRLRTAALRRPPGQIVA